VTQERERCKWSLSRALPELHAETVRKRGQRRPPADLSQSHLEAGGRGALHSVQAADCQVVGRAGRRQAFHYLFHSGGGEGGVDQRHVGQKTEFWKEKM
jgi:hypothetical protein